MYHPHHSVKFTANAVEYPFFADFVLDHNGRKLAVFVLCYSKLYGNLHTVMHQQIRLSIQYFKQRGYEVLELRYDDYTHDTNKIGMQLAVALA